MESSDSDGAEAEVSEYSDKYELHGVGLKPVLDDIFKEVQANIPVLNFEDSAEVSHIIEIPFALWWMQIAWPSITKNKNKKDQNKPLLS